MNRDTVLLVMFDLPVTDRAARRGAARFRRGLIRNGYTMLQRSIYFKLITNVSLSSYEYKQISEMFPGRGDVRFLPIPLNQFSRIQTLGQEDEMEDFDLDFCFSPLVEFV